MTHGAGADLRADAGDRLTKQGLYDSPAYWDMKAEAYQGLARSNWPSNTYNRHWDERQMAHPRSRARRRPRARDRRRRVRHRSREPAPRRARRERHGARLRPATLEAARARGAPSRVSPSTFASYDALDAAAARSRRPLRRRDHHLVPGDGVLARPTSSIERSAHLVSLDHARGAGFSSSSRSIARGCCAAFSR